MQKVLKYRRDIEKQLKFEFLSINNQLSKERETLSQLNKKYYEYETLYKDSLKDNLNVMKINQNKRALEFMETKIKEQKEIIIKTEEVLEETRVKLEQAIKDRKMLDKLKEKEYEKYKVELRREEDKEIDEFVSFRYGRTIKNE